jgi:hypothetical protein
LNKGGFEPYLSHIPNCSDFAEKSVRLVVMRCR